MIHTLTQGHLLPMVAPAAILTRIGRIDFDKRPASFFRFARQSVKKSCPRSIGHAFRQAMMMRHALDMQVFHANDPETINDVPTLLMGEIITSEGNAFMDSCDNLAMLATLRSPFGKLSMLALDFGKGFLFLAKKARIDYL